jgi:hypothetical protein
VKVATVIKELSSHLGNGLGAIFSSWSVYVLIAVGAATMLLAAHALAAGPLAASQPGITVLDPLTASLLGVFLSGEHIRTGVFDLAGPGHARRWNRRFTARCRRRRGRLNSTAAVSVLAATATGVWNVNSWVASRTSPAYATVSSPVISAYLILRRLRRDRSGNVTAQHEAPARGWQTAIPQACLADENGVISTCER